MEWANLVYLYFIDANNVSFESRYAVNIWGLTDVCKYDPWPVINSADSFVRQTMIKPILNFIKCYFL